MAADDKKKKRMPARPRAILGDLELLPMVDMLWQPVEGMWMLPGRAAPLTTKEVRDLARSTGQAFCILKST